MDYASEVLALEEHSTHQIEGQKTVETVDLTTDVKVSMRAVPDFSRLRGYIYKLFTWLEEERLWKCKICSTSLQHHPKCGSATLITHFKTKHPQQLEQSKQPSSEQPSVSRFLGPKKAPPLPVTKDGVRLRISELIIAADLPFNFVEQHNFVNLMTYVSRENPQVVPLVSRTTAKTDIEKLYRDELLSLKNELQSNIGKISLSVDCWTSSNQFAFQGVFATWVDNDWCSQGSLLDLTILEGSHTGENLAYELGKVITTFELWNKIMAITTDNAGNMNTMFQELDKLALENNSDFVSEDQRVRCLAHIINLSCKELIKVAEEMSPDNVDASVDNDEIDGENWCMGNGILKKFRSAVRSIRGSPQRLRTYENACLKENLKKNALLRDVQTRWNSTYDMLVRGMEMRRAFERTIHSIPDLNKYKITDDEWEFIDQLIKMLTPFKKATLRVSKDAPTLADTAGVYQYLFEHLENYMDGANHSPSVGPSTSKRARRNDPELHYPDWVIRSANAAWEKLKQYYPSSDTLVYLVASVMDPRLKFDWFKALKWEDSWRKEARKAVTNFWERVYMPSEDGEETTETPDFSKTSAAAKDEFDMMYESRMKKYYRSEDELKQYLSEPVAHAKSLNNGILGWWKQNESRFPNLSRMAKDILSAQGTGVSMERFFSSGPDLLTLKRQRLTAESIHECLAVKAWIKRKNATENRQFSRDLRLYKALGEIEECNEK